MIPILSDDLDLANRHVAQGEERVAQQVALIDRLKEQGLPANEAETLRVRFENTLALLREHQRQLQTEHSANEHA